LLAATLQLFSSETHVLRRKIKIPQSFLIFFIANVLYMALNQKQQKAFVLMEYFSAVSNTSANI
jgi:hypothetical protein